MSQLKTLTTRINTLETQYRDFIIKHAETATTVATLSEGQLTMITCIATLTENIDMLVSRMDKADKASIMAPSHPRVTQHISPSPPPLSYLPPTTLSPPLPAATSLPPLHPMHGLHPPPPLPLTNHGANNHNTRELHVMNTILVKY